MLSKSSFIALAFLVALPGCPGEKDDSAAEGECLSGNITLSDANNYSLEGSIDVPSVETAEGVDITICWDALTQDLQCHDVDPLEDIDNVSVVRFLTKSDEEIEQLLSNNELQASASGGFVQDTQDGTQTCTSLSEMTMFGTPWDLSSKYVSAGGTFMLLLTSGVVPGVGARALAFLEPSPTSKVTQVDMGDACGILDLNVDLASLSTLSICDEGSWTVDWSGLTTDGQGNAIELAKINSVMIGFFEGKTLADLEANFLDLELDATRMWTLDLAGGTSADLSLATDGAETFAGFSGEGVWVLALRCSTCPNPAPLFLTVLEPAAPTGGAR